MPLPSASSAPSKSSFSGYDTSKNLEELQLALRNLRDRYNNEWLIERLHFQSPRQARERFLALKQAA